MPYISQEQRKSLMSALTELTTVINSLARDDQEKVGILNYCITKLLLDTITKNGVRYHKINSINGILTSVIQEINTRITRPYEESKIIQNGDVDSFERLT